jgi:hypothetical protein
MLGASDLINWLIRAFFKDPLLDIGGLKKMGF